MYVRYSNNCVVNIITLLILFVPISLLIKAYLLTCPYHEEVFPAVTSHSYPFFFTISFLPPTVFHTSKDKTIQACLFDMGQQDHQAKSKSSFFCPRPLSA